MARRCCCLPAFMFTHRWKWPKVLIALMILELAGTIAALALFGIADPNLYRTKMWQVGSDNGFNSDPNEILLAYANYQPIPTTPFVWSKTLTSYNVAIGVLSMFIQLVKVVMFVMHIWYPLLGTITNLGITALWIVSIVGQAGPDHSDPKHPSSIAWYIAKSCKYASARGWEHYCVQAKATFAVSIFMMTIFFFNFALGVYSIIPSRSARLASKLEYDDNQDTDDSPTHDKDLEMTSSVRLAQQTPYTPRTTAFNTLSGGPQRGGDRAFADRPLPFRQTQSSNGGSGKPGLTLTKPDISYA